MTYTLEDLETFCTLAAGKAMEAVLPEEPPYAALKALAGDPLILAASDEQEARRRYAAMRDVLMEKANASVENTERKE